MSYKYWLPDESGQKREYETQNNVIIIIGANGSGKSKLGAWIELQNIMGVHRVGAQRNLNFNENIPLKNYTEAENLVFFGYGDGKDINKNHRWQYGHYTTKLMDDYESVLAAIIALKNNEITKFHKLCKDKGDNKADWPDIPITSIDKIQHIWKSVFSQRELIEDDSKFYAGLNKNGRLIKYSATEMSDGERAVLYLAAQVLSVPKNKILIIDEPEVHLHPSVMNRLWKELESCREDCLFIYITHDLNFASTHGNAEKIWIKDFDGEHWKLERIIEENIPEELVFEILGSRKNVLFVEGETNSYDSQLYTQIYHNHLVIPCGGCTQVIERTKAFRNSKMLHECTVYGLIDRDYRSEREIASLKEKGIYVIDVAEVENLFLVEELVEFVAKRFAVKDVEQTIENIKNFVINTKFANMIERQLCQSVVAEIKYQLSCIEIESKNEEDAKNTLKKGLDGISYDAIRNEKETIFRQALKSKDYKSILRVFNEKGISKIIGNFLGINNNEYQEKVINLLNRECHGEIVKLLRDYLPNEIPI
ncbi:MAG: AAA family ATPase [Lachnospiraceae bacterium]|nr:AAA family ATPase [Lachnospiraceae bacterium]